MRILHNALEDAVGKLPKEAITRLVERKLGSQGVKLTSSELKRLQEHIFSGKSEALRIKRWRFWENQHYSLELSDKEIQGIEEQFTHGISEQLPKIIETVTAELAAKILSDLKRRWSKEWNQERSELSRFQKRLDRVWGVPLGQLQMLLTMAREFGESLNQELRGPGIAQPHLVEVLTRLHARACQVSEEILVLLRSGLADGAIARWRTLHEIAVVALFIGQHGEELAERYVLHQAIESNRAANEYNAIQQRIGCEPLEPNVLSDTDHVYQSLLHRYGAEFANQYGWAAEKLLVKSPRFSDIERAAGFDILRPFYRMASHNIHANPKGVFFKLGLLEDSDLLLAGPSDLGLADPGHNTATSLVLVCMPFGPLFPTLDNNVALLMMRQFEQEIADAFWAVHQRLLEQSADLSKTE